MPLLWLAITGLGGLFVGSQVDNAVQSAAAAPQIVDQSKAPWWIPYVIAAIVALIAWQLLKKGLK